MIKHACNLISDRVIMKVYMGKEKLDLDLNSGQCDPNEGHCDLNKGQTPWSDVEFPVVSSPKWVCIYIIVNIQIYHKYLKFNVHTDLT